MMDISIGWPSYTQLSVSRGVLMGFTATQQRYIYAYTYTAEATGFGLDQSWSMALQGPN